MPTLNTPEPVSQVRRPRARLLVDGQEVLGAASASVVNNNYFEADRWSATLALGADPTRDAAWWAAQDEVEVEVQFGFIPDAAAEGRAEWRSFVTGLTDRISVDFESQVVHLDGRDLTALLLREYVVESFPNKTASDIAREFAASVGLGADVDTTSARVGQYFRNDFSHASTGEFGSSTTKWDFLVELARKEGMDVWVSGTTLHFKRAAEPDKSSPYEVRYVPPVLDRANGSTVATGAVLNATSLRADRNLDVAKDVEVVVRSWSVSEARQFEVVASRRAASLARENKGRQGRGRNPNPDDPLSQIPGYGVRKGAADDPLSAIPGYGSSARRGTAATNDRAPRRSAGLHRYLYVKPGLSHEQALEFAQNALREATRHERSVDLAMPGDVVLSPRVLIRLTGTGTAFDQDYYVESIERVLSFDGGFTQGVHAKNETPGGTTTVTSGAS